MALQNRVTPFGAIESDPARGLVMGNRGGRLHDPAARTLMRRRWASSHWIICLTQFRQRQRTIMSPSSYTELFFLDEVTALAAGHRPCYECQRQRALQFAEAFAQGRNQKKMKAGEIDRCLHGQRFANGHSMIPVTAEAVCSLPDGVMIALGKDCYAMRDGKLLRWTHGGYHEAIAVKPDGQYKQLTPPSTAEAISAGFSPRFHPTATS